MGPTEDQALTTHTRNNYKKKENHHHNKKQKKFKKYASNIRCYTCDENGYFSRDYPKNKDSFNKKKRHHAHTTEDDEPTNKRLRKEKDDYDEEYVLISALMGTISHGINDWLVDSGASKHIT